MSPDFKFEGPSISRLTKQRYALIGEKCSCGANLFPPRDICPECGGNAKEEFQFSGWGRVYSFTTVYNPPAGYEDSAPYTVGLIDLEEGPRVTAQITDLGDDPIEIGTLVKMVTRGLGNNGNERGLLKYGYKFRRPLVSEIPDRFKKDPQVAQTNDNSGLIYTAEH